MGIVPLALIVFSIVLVLTKSKILAGKREFVEERYELAKNNGDPGWVHRWWNAIWTCPMCCGFWMALPVCLFWPVYGYIADVMIVFGLNWLFHCLENALFFSGETFENVDSLVRKTDLTKTARYAKDIMNKIEKKFLK